MNSLTLFSPSGVVAKAPPLRLAAKRLAALGFEVQTDASALARQQRFAGPQRRQQRPLGAALGGQRRRDHRR